MYKFLFLVVGLSLASVSMNAQTVQGWTVDLYTNQVVPNAEIQLVRNGKILKTVNSDARGMFTLKVKRDKAYQIMVNKAGYSTKTIPFALHKTDNAAQPIRLYLSPQQLRVSGRVKLPSNEGIPGVDLRLVNLSSLVSVPLISGVDGKFSSNLEFNQNYRLELHESATRSYSMSPVYFSTDELIEPQTIVKDLLISKKGEVVLENNEPAETTTEINRIDRKPIEYNVEKAFAEGIMKDLDLGKTEPKTETRVVESVSEIKPVTSMHEVELLEDLPEGYKILKVVEGQQEIPTSSNSIETEAPSSGIKIFFGGDPNEPSYGTEAVEEIPDENDEVEVVYHSSPVEQDNNWVEGENIYYKSGKAFLTPSVKSHLDRLSSDMQKTGQRLFITVHSDANEEKDIEDYICKIRSEHVVGHLIESGIDFSRLVVKIVGHKDPTNDCGLGSNCSDAQYQANRRVELILQ